MKMISLFATNSSSGSSVDWFCSDQSYSFFNYQSRLASQLFCVMNVSIVLLALYASAFWLSSLFDSTSHHFPLLYITKRKSFCQIVDFFPGICQFGVNLFTFVKNSFKTQKCSSGNVACSFDNSAEKILPNSQKKISLKVQK